MLKKSSIPFIVPILFLFTVFVLMPFAVTLDVTNINALEGVGFGHKSSGHINTVTTEIVNLAFDLSNDLNPYDPQQSNESIGIAPRTQTFIASYVDGVTSTRPLPVVNSKSMYLNIDAANRGVDIFHENATSEVQVYGSYMAGSNHINSSTIGWIPLVWTKVGAQQIAQIVSASQTFSDATGTSAAFTDNSILADGTVFTPASEVGSVISATGTYVFDIRGIQNVAIFVKDVTDATTVITKTLSEY